MSITTYRPRSFFVPFHQRGKRWSVLVCHRRAGKTVAAINDIVARALNTAKVVSQNPPQYAYIAPFREQAKRVAWDYLMRATAAPGMRTATNIADLTCTLFNGTKIMLFGADNPDAIRGIYLDGVVIDEPAMMRPRVFSEVIRPLLADRKGWCVFIGTPAGKNEFWRLREEARQNPEEWFYMELRASQSGILDAAELDGARRVMSEDEFLQEFECSFDAAIRGAYYGRILNDMGNRIGHYPHDPMLPVHVSLDLGYTDSTALWYWQALGQELRYIRAEEHSGLALSDYVDIMRAQPYVYGDVWLPHDARARSLQTGRSILELLRHQHGIKCDIAPEFSVQQGIQAARFVLTSTTTYIHAAGCAEAIEALRQYQREFDDKKQAFKEQPKHDWTSHYADSFRYSSLIAHRGARDSVNRITPQNAPRRYDPSLPFGGNVRLEDCWGTVPQSAEQRY
jgi:hypothetical protein